MDINDLAPDEIAPYALVPIKDKLLLTIKEAALYSGIGQNRLYQVVGVPNCAFSVRVGSKWLIHRQKFEQWLAEQKRID